MNDIPPGVPGYYKDLTPGTFMAEDKIDVELDSLGNFGNTFQRETMSVYGASMPVPMGLVKSDYAKGIGDRAVGNDTTFSELVAVANYVSGKGGAAEAAEKLTQDLMFGNMALANVAMVMAENYGVTDGFNGAQLASAVTDAFTPPSGTGLDKMWSKTDGERAERNRIANLPRVDPSDVKYWNMSGHVAGEDYIIEDSSGGGTGLPTNFEDTAHDGDVTNGEDTTPDDPKTEKKEQGNEFYVIPKEDDYDPTRDPYTPPQPEDDTVTLAPGQNYANTPGNDTGTVV